MSLARRSTASLSSALVSLTTGAAVASTAATAPRRLSMT